MHAPDGFLNAGTAVATGAVSAGTIGVALRRTRETLLDTQVPLAGLAAAFVFAAQMLNFPVAAGTTGHLLGGALAAVLLGPAAGALVVAVVVIVQAVAFADGGLTALGYNILNMAIITAFGGYGVYLLARRLLPGTGTSVVVATGVAAFASVALSSMAFSIEWLFGATAPVPFDTVFAAVVGVHGLIGVGEAVISALAVGAVLASRPDLVHGARDLGRTAAARRPAIGMRGFAIGAAVVALTLATVVSQFAVPGPDGLAKAATETGFADQGRPHALSDAVFSGYATAGVDNEALSLAVAGAVGVAITLAVGYGMFAAVGDRRRDRGPAGPRAPA
ncbi:MAG: energy-coupling factor ABC transporter permease [Actinomycetota bacterium]|nr:energy-coupling factor ABC transporter permease [Actinomycetota bacterium]